MCERTFTLFGLSQKEKNHALYEAIEEGASEYVRRLLARGADANYATYNYGPVIFRAISISDETQSIDCIKALIEHGASLDKRDDYGRTPLHYAAYRSYYRPAVLKTLVDAGADVTRRDSSGQTPLMTAIGQKGWQAAELLMRYAMGDDVSTSRVMIAAITKGAPLKFLKELHDALGSDVNAVEPAEQTTALMAAVAAGRCDAVQWLLEQDGIDVDRVNARGETALALAVAGGHTEIVRALVAAGARADSRDAEGQTPIVTAARANSQEILELLVGGKASLDHADKYGSTALSVAASAGSIRMVMTLLSAAESRDEKLALDAPMAAAAEKGHGRVVELLIGAGADVNAPDADGRTPLMKAALSDQVEALSILVKAGAKPDVPDRHGMHAYDHAVSAGKTKAKDYLARYRHETIKTGDTVEVAAPAQDYRFARVNDHSLEVREGDGLTMTFNFWTQQVIFRDTERPAPLTVQNFADLQRQEAIDEAYAKLKELGGNPPDPHTAMVSKKMPGLSKF